MPRRILALVPDVFFFARIRETARQCDAEAVCARPESLADAPPDCALVLIDLEADAVSALAAVARLRADPARVGVRVIAYGPHVEAELLQRARDAGCDVVLPRSQFSARLAELLGT